MTNRERVLALIRQKQAGLTDTEIRQRTGIQPHQQVNQICRRLHQQGLTERSPGPDGVLLNRPRSGLQIDCEPRASARRRSGPQVRSHEPTPAPYADGVPRLSLPDTLFVLPCSAEKRRGGQSSPSDNASMLRSLPRSLAAELKACRAGCAPSARLDESKRLPAAERYAGTLYQAAGNALDELSQAGADILIISGGYGVVHPLEPIGEYDHEFRNSMWPNRIVARCLAAYAEAVGARTVVGLLSGTTQYARVFRSTQWTERVEQAIHIRPQAVRGAMVKAPRALGEALRTISRDHRLLHDWTSSDGLQAHVDRLR